MYIVVDNLLLKSLLQKYTQEVNSKPITMGYGGRLGPRLASTSSLLYCLFYNMYKIIQTKL